ncbi:integral membrane protein S linking to the trans Golgi network-domain-containing protein [Mortierella sp. GBAus27b]|nr:integral membrane protein S linking to the trans Golgi network-domain-containing protein [Mortierella sp. GBAus27b]
MANNSSSFRTTQWDPVLILAIWYISISTIVFTLFRFSGTDITLDAILNYREIRVDNPQGVLLGIAWLLNSVVGVFLLLKIVARARLVLDFSLTVLFYHVVMTTLYSDHLPTSFLWWALNGTTAGIMIFGGEYVCMQWEMEPIMLGGGASRANTSRANTSRANTSNIPSSSSDSRADHVGGNSSSISGSGVGGGGIDISSGSNQNLAMQGGSLANMYHDGYGYNENSGLLMDTFDGGESSGRSAQKARSSEDTHGMGRGPAGGSSGFGPTIRSSIQHVGRQRTSDGYKPVPHRSMTADGETS